MTKKIYSIIALLCLAVSGAWADPQEELLTTVTATGQTTFSQSPEGIVTVTLSNIHTYMAEFGWMYGGTVTVTAASDDYTITRCVFKQNDKDPLEDDNDPFTATITIVDGVYAETKTGQKVIDNMDGITSIEVYGVKKAPAGPEVSGPTIVDGKPQWTFLMPDYDVEVGVVYDTELALSEETDNTAALDEWDGYEADVTLTRTLQTGGWNTLALPFNVEAATLAAINAKLAMMSGSMTVKELTGSSFENGTLTLNFGDATSMKAGTPYLVKVTPAAVNLATMPFAGAEVSKTAVTVETTAVDFVPTLGLTKVTGDPKEILFVSSGNKLLHPTTLPDNMKGFRAYFKLKGDAVNASSFTLDFGDGNTTGIQTIENGEVNSESVYDLQGRRVESSKFNVESSKLTKGVYIVNGRKVVVR